MRDKQQLLLSIIVPVYNVENHIVRCLSSLVNQTEKRIEIILIDDGSQDKSGILCDEFAMKHSELNIKVIHQENAGVSAARNCGINMAKAKYITFLDSDDYFSDEFVKVFVECAEINGADIVIGGYIVDKGDEKKAYVPIKEIMSTETALKKLCNNTEIKSYAWGKIYRKEMFDLIRFPLGRYYEDILTIYKVFQKAKKIVSIDDTHYFYCIREGGITGKSKTDSALSYHRCVAYIERYRELCFEYPDMIPFMLLDLIFSIGLLAKTFGNKSTENYPEIKRFAKDILEREIPGLDNLDWIQKKELEEILNNRLFSKKILVLHFIHRIVNRYKKMTRKTVN